jgi:hypothetical protein
MKSRMLLPALLLPALLCAACAPAALLPYQLGEYPTTTLPVTLAGVTDARAGFATLIDAELKAAGDNRPVHWLHLGHAGRPTSALPTGLAATFAARAPSTSVLIVGGLFGDCLGPLAVPFGDGVVRETSRSLDEGYRQYDDLRLHSIHIVRVPGRASSRENGHLVAEAIRAAAMRPEVRRIVVVGYSKGVPDVLHALALLQGDGGVPPELKAFISVAGVVMGSPLADFYQPMYEAVSPLVTPFECTPSRGGDVGSLTRRARISWLVANPPPTGLMYFSIAAHAPLDEIAPALRFTARQLAAIDPHNDGQLIAAETILPGSTLLAEARADHWDVAIPRDRDPNPLLRASTSGRGYPREALFRAMIKWVVTAVP